MFSWFSFWAFLCTCFIGHQHCISDVCSLTLETECLTIACSQPVLYQRRRRQRPIGRQATAQSCLIWLAWIPHIYSTLSFQSVNKHMAQGGGRTGKQMNVSSSSSGRPPTKSHPVPCTCILIKDAKNKHKMQMKQKQSIISHHQPSQNPKK